MSKKKTEPIKEVKELADLIHSEDETIVVLFYNDSLVLAERLYNAGYRKASDVAREIFEEIEKYSEVALMNGHIETPILCIGFGVSDLEACLYS